MDLSESGRPGVSAKYEKPRPLVNTDRCRELNGSTAMTASANHHIIHAAVQECFRCPAHAAHSPRCVFLDLNRHAQEGRRNGGRIVRTACVLTGEQIFQLLLQIGCAPVLFRGVERIHGRSVVFSEFIHET